MSLPRSTPAAQGLDATGLREFVVALDRDGLAPHSVMVARHGQVVAEGWWHPYAADRPALVYSLSKTVTATAVGLLVDEGQLTLDDPVLGFFPEIEPGEVAPLWAEVLVKHCLSMTVGHEVDPWQDVAGRARSSWSGAPDNDHDNDSDNVNDRAETVGDDWVRHVFATTPTVTPGTLFTYNQVATYLLSRIVAKVTGSGVVEALRARLLGELGVDDIPWGRDPWGHELGFSGAHLTTEAILTLAQLYLGRGVIGDRRLLSQQWCDAATTGFGPTDLRPGVNPDWDRGYGYSFWMQQVGCRGDGAYGQFLVVLPEHDVALAITSEQENMQATLDLVWRHVVPAVDRVGGADADAELAALLASRRIEPSTGGAEPGEEASLERSPDSDLATRYTGATIRRDGSSWVVDLRRETQVLPVRVGSGEWTASTLTSGGYQLPVVASGGWRDADTFVADVIVIETPHRFEVVGHRSSGQVALRWRRMPLNGPDPLDLAVRRAD